MSFSTGFFFFFARCVLTYVFTSRRIGRGRFKIVLYDFVQILSLFFSVVAPFSLCIKIRWNF